MVGMGSPLLHDRRAPRGESGGRVWPGKNRPEVEAAGPAEFSTNRGMVPLHGAVREGLQYRPRRAPGSRALRDAARRVALAPLIDLHAADHIPLAGERELVAGVLREEVDRRQRQQLAGPPA